MKVRLIALLSALALVSFTSERANTTYRVDPESSSLEVTGTSTLHDWSAQAKQMKGSILWSGDKEQFTVKSLELIIPVKSLKSGKSKMDNNMYEALNQGEHPEVRYEFTKVKSQRSLGEGKQELSTLGKLTVAGQTRQVEIPLEAHLSSQGIKLQGSTGLKMTTFDIEPPSFMFGSVTTGDRVNIHFEIHYKS